MTETAHESRAKSALEIAVAARAVQLAIRARLLRDVTQLWPALDPKRVDETFPGWIRAMSLLVRSYHGQSAAAAASSYRAAREQATHSPAPRSLIHLAPTPSPEWLDKAFGFSGPGMLNRDTAKPGTALSTTLGTSARIALDGGRTTTADTIAADPVALGWFRVTDDDPCAFCALLASRPVLKGKGSLYTSKDSFAASNAKFEGSGEFKVHNGCGCSLAPLFSADQELPKANQEAAEVYQNRGDGPALKAFRKAWESRNAA